MYSMEEVEKIHCQQQIHVIVYLLRRSTWAESYNNSFRKKL